MPIPKEVEPIRNIKDINKIKQYLYGKENKRDYCIFVVGINVGLRAGDLLSLKISDVTDGKTIFDEVTIKEEKTGKARTFVLNKNAKDAIRTYLDTFKSVDLNDYLFKSRKGGHLGVRPLHHIIKSTLKDLGIKGNYGTHTLRKTMAFHRYINKVPIETLQKMLNHSSSEITLRYIGITKEVITDCYNAVNL
ncbi:MAG: tyrosine-type recombinase/integrase [Oscillospiraceae bacterium]|nr:tyrosine-type recombinase/integrase [Oscillospiraceae bacterium]